MAQLTDLPNELISEIVELVHATHKRHYLGAVSTLFLPFSRHLFFNEVKVTSYERLALFCDVVKGNQEVATYPKLLDLNLTDEEDGGSPKSRAVSALFSRLTSLAELNVINATRIVQLVLAPPATGRVLPSLVILKLQDKFEKWSNPFAPIHYSNLERYRRLNWLELDIQRGHSSLGRYSRASEPPRLLLGGLELSGSLNGNPAVLDLLACCPYLAQLVLTDWTTSRGDNLGPLLAAVPNPLGIRGLQLTEVFEGDEDLSGALSRFPNLEELFFRAGSFLPAVIPLLHSFQSLTRLYFAPFAAVSTDDLLALLGPHKPPKLQAVKLYNVWTRREWDDYDEMFFERVQGWSVAFSRVGMRKVVAAAKAAGVEISGYAVEVVEADLKREQARLEAAEARKKAAAGAVRG
ncbi:hypothetical protein JCM8097_002755 [Rhodosporidiobolus ruineniae]